MDISCGFYQQLTETQAILKSEAILQNNNISDLFKTQIKSKKYYFRLFLIKACIFLKDIFDSPLKDFKFAEIKYKLLMSEGEIPELFSRDKLAEVLKSMKNVLKSNQIFIDLLTFGILPSLFNMFFTESDLSDFILFIEKLNHDPNDKEGVELQIAFSRCLFSSPNLILFIFEVFQPIFNRFSNGQIKGITEKALLYETKLVQQKLLQSIKNKISCFPISIKIFIDAIKRMGLNQQEFLSQAFFTPMITFPEFFLLLNYFEKDVYGNCEKITSFIQKVFDSNFINKFLEVLNGSTELKNNLIQQKYITDNTRAFSYLKVIDNFDYIAFDCIMNQKEFNLIDILDRKEKYSISLAHIASELPPIDELLTFRKFIIQLPKLNSDFNFEEHANIQSIKDIFLHFSGKLSIEGQVNYLLLSNFFNNKLSNMDLNEIDSLFKKVKVMNSIEEKANLEIRRYGTEFFLMHFNDINVFRENNLLFKTVFTQKIELSMNLPNIRDVVNDPMKYNNEFNLVIYPQFNSLAESHLGKHKYMEIIYHRYFKNVHYNNYLIERKDLIKIDKLLYSYMITKYKTIFNFIDNTNVTNKQDRKIHTKLFEVLQHLHKFNDLAIQFNDVFLINCDPLLKDNKISKVFSSVHKLAVAEFKLDSADHMGILYPIFFFFAHPQNLFSNIAFLNDFQYYPENINGSDNNFKVYNNFFFLCINQDLGDYAIIPKKYSPSFLKMLEINVIGDNNDLIIYVCNQFLKGFQSNYEINQSDIEKGVLLEIPFEFDIFDNMDLFFYFKGRIRIQANLSKRYSVDLSKFKSYILVCCQNETTEESAIKIQNQYSNFRKNIKIISSNCSDFPKRKKINNVVEVIPKSQFRWSPIISKC